MENSRPVHRVDKQVYMDANEVTVGNSSSLLNRVGTAIAIGMM